MEKPNEYLEAYVVTRKLPYQATPTVMPTSGPLHHGLLRVGNPSLICLFLTCEQYRLSGVLATV